MKLQVRNCVTDPRFKELRRKGKPVFKPSIQGSVLSPGAVRVINANSLSLADVNQLDSLVKSGSCLVAAVGVGYLDDMSSVMDYLGFSSEPEPVVEEASAPEPEPEPEPVVEPEPEPAPEPVVEEVVEEEPAEEEQSGYTESELAGLKNSELREIALSIDSEASVSGLSKKKLVALVMELQNG